MNQLFVSSHVAIGIMQLCSRVALLVLIMIMMYIESGIMLDSGILCSCADLLQSQSGAAGKVAMLVPGMPCAMQFCSSQISVTHLRKLGESNPIGDRVHICLLSAYRLQFFRDGMQVTRGLHVYPWLPAAFGYLRRSRCAASSPSTATINTTPDYI